MKAKTKNIIRNFFKWGSLTCFLTAVTVIFVEAAMPSSISAGQSNDVAGVVQDELDKNHDKETIKEIKDFNINFINSKDLYFVGDKLKYEVSYIPIDTSFKNINYKISDNSLISLNVIGREITFLKSGDASITFYSEKNSNLSHTFSFSIKNIEATKLEIKSKIACLNIGDSETIEYEILPNNTTIKEVIFESSNPDIVSINKSGTIKALKGGKSIIKISLKNNPLIFDTITINVLDEFHEDVTAIKINQLSLFNNESKEFYGEYFPLSSSFNLNLLKLNNNDKNLTFKTTKVDRSKGRFYFKLTYKNLNFVSEEEFPLTFSYEKLSSNTSLKISPQSFLNETLVDDKKLKLNLNGKILESTYYNLPKKYVEQVIINVPFKSEVTKNTAKYDLKAFSIENSSDIKIISSSYNKIVIEKIYDTPGISTLKYFFNKNDKNNYLTFEIDYKVITSDVHISDISLTKFNEDKPTALFLGDKYKSIFTYKIFTESLNEESTGALNNTPIDIDLTIDSSEVISLEKDKNNNVISLIPKKVGVAKLIVTSRLENALNFSRGIKKTYTIQITDKPNNSYLTIDSQKLNESKLTIKKGDNIEVKLVFEYITKFKDNTSQVYVINGIDYDFIFNETNLISFNKNTHIISGLKGGQTSLLLMPKDKSLYDLKKNLTLIIDHIAIDINEFNASFEVIKTPEFNKPSKDFSIVPINSSFKVIAETNEDATNKEIFYHSSNKDIIEINPSTGIANTKKQGKATITIISKDDPSIKISKTIDVIDTSSPFKIDKETLKPLKFEEVKDKNNKFSHYHISLNYGESYKLKIITSLENCTSKSIKYTFENKSGNQSELDIVTIDNEGNIITKNIGSTRVKVTYGDNPINQYSKYIVFEVYRDQQMPFKEMAYKLRKLIGHFALFGATALSGLVFIFLEFKGKKLQTIVLVIYTFIGFLVSFISEVIQGFIPGRYYTIEDVLLNTFGFAIVTLTFIGILLILIILEYFKKKKETKETLELILCKKDDDDH